MRSLILVLACAGAPPSSPPTIPPASPAVAPDAFVAGAVDLSGVVAPVFNRHAVPGMAFAVVERDRLVGLGVAGVRQRGTEHPIGRDDRFHLGSCTKAVTATLAATLVAEGTLRFDSTVGDILGREDGTIDASWKDVTVEMLLRNRGGAPANANREDWAKAFGCTASPRECRAAFVRSMLSRPTETAPGQYVYSNQGYALAGHLCEVAAGRPYEELVVERLLRPLGITTAGFGPPSAATGGQSPVGHAADGTVRDHDNPAAIAPAGRLHLSLTDWARFVALHLRQAPPEGIALTPELLAQLHTSPRDGVDGTSYACGWLVGPSPLGGRTLSHAGSNTLWYALAVVSPERGCAVLVATNQGGDVGERACGDVAATLLEWELARLRSSDIQH